MSAEVVQHAEEWGVMVSVSLQLTQRGQQALDGGKVESQVHCDPTQVGQQQLLILPGRESRTRFSTMTNQVLQVIML